MNDKSNPDSKARVIGLDAHPDTFTAALVRGPTPAAAITEKVFNKIPMRQLASWARKHTEEDDLFLLEASGNSFQIVRELEALGRRALVLESCQLGKLKEAHANNDKISAIRIAKAYLAGTAKEVWVPDALTLERRECLFAHEKCVRRVTQLRNRVRSYLSDHGVRLKKNPDWSDLQTTESDLRQQATWSPRQWLVLKGLLLELAHAQEQREHWHASMAREVLEDPLLLSLTRLCGVRETVAYALGAIIGDINRFESPRKLVKYIGLNPAYDLSGKGGWTGGVGRRGRKDLRALLVQSAQSILRSNDPLRAWGKRLLARKGVYNLVVCAVARKLVVRVWYLMKGRWSELRELDRPLKQKVGTMIGRMGAKALKEMDQSRQQLTQAAAERLTQGRRYVLKPRSAPPVIQSPLGG